VSPAGLAPRSLLLLCLTLAGLAAVYLPGLGAVGVLGPDEPRYASIGREMADSGDWITPRLWGSPWFEKPPLLYWLIAAGHACGLGDDLAPRLPVALVSLAFLIVQFLLLRRLFDQSIAWIATLLLGTCAGWLAYSQVGVTDLPLAACFSAALLLGVLWLDIGSRPVLYACAVCFALAVLAKGLVPVVLALPFLWFARSRWRELIRPAGLSLLIASPWYLAMLVIHGRSFFDDFFIRHHLSRFSSDELQHIQPFWYYLPVLIGALFPWSALLGVLGSFCWRDTRLRIFTTTFLFGFVFFSISANKLPGYLLPLLPPLCVVLAIGAGRAADLTRPLALTTILVALCPVVVTVLPESLLYGLRRAQIAELKWEYFAAVLPITVVVWWLDSRRRRLAAFAVAAVLAGAGLGFVKIAAAPMLDELVSTRGLWRRVEPRISQTCVDSLHRALRYGLNYYSRQPLPDCQDDPRPFAIVQQPRAIPRLVPRVKPPI